MQNYAVMHDRVLEQRLLDNIKRKMPELEGLLARSRSHWEYEDYVYRFYHQSFKAFGVQGMTLKIVNVLRSLLPGVELNRRFLSIIESGTGREFSLEMNGVWDSTTRPLLEAFFHARFMLEMVVKYGRELRSPATTLPSGWAAVLYLYELR